ncbi:hypothetical protein Tco_0447665, partial [Tanacetum coccineum]
YVIRAIHGPRLELHSYSTQSVWGVILSEVQLLASVQDSCWGWGQYQIKVAAKFGDSSLADSFRRQVRDGVKASQWTKLLSLIGSITPRILGHCMTLRNS